MPLEEHYLRFTGKGSDYFPIWFMNLLGTLATFGLYGPWAKVRRLKFFYRHTQVGYLGGLDFHGKPTSILLGRLLFMAYAGLSAFFSNSVIIKAGLAILFGVALPWMVFSSIRFYVNNTTWRGVRFRFHGRPAKLYAIVLGVLIVLVAFVFLLILVLQVYVASLWQFGGLLFMMLLPAVFLPLLGGFLWAFWRYRINNTSLGSVRFSLPVSWNAFVIRFFLAGLLIGVLCGLSIGMVFLLKGHEILRTSLDYKGFSPILVGLIFFLFIFITYSFLNSLLVVQVQNLVFNHARLEENEFRSELMTMRWLTTYLTNVLLKVLSLGLYTPYAATRMAKLRVESVTLLAGASLLDIVNTPPAQSEAIGAEMSVIDFEFGL